MVIRIKNLGLRFLDIVLNCNWFSTIRFKMLLIFSRYDVSCGAIIIKMSPKTVTEWIFFPPALLRIPFSQ